MRCVLFGGRPSGRHHQAPPLPNGKGKRDWALPRIQAWRVEAAHHESTMSWLTSLSFSPPQPCFFKPLL